jgi:hypothetical protein
MSLCGAGIATEAGAWCVILTSARIKSALFAMALAYPQHLCSSHAVT